MLPSELIPRPHVFSPDRATKGDTCLICGEVDAFGALHITQPAAFDVDDDFGKPQACDRCPHFRHSGACDVVVSRWPVRLCPCGGERNDAVA